MTLRAPRSILLSIVRVILMMPIEYRRNVRGISSIANPTISSFHRVNVMGVGLLPA
jgi:hypothetical protein